VNGRRLQLTWPLTVLFTAFPLWWLLGVSAFMWVIIPVPMFVAIVWRQRTKAPLAIVLWFGFVSWVLLSGLQLQSSTKILTFSYRLLLYAGSAVLFLYIYNLPRSRQLDSKILRILTIFWVIVVIGGFAGILIGSHAFTAPIEHILPHGLRDKPFVQELIQPVFAEVQAFLGYPIPRPAAPFTYTNEWGGNIAALTPVALAAAAAAGRGLRRRLMVALLVASLVPMAFSLNRGMFLSLGAGILYVALRLAFRGRFGALFAVLALTAVAAVLVAATPLGHLVTASFASSHGHSNSTRASLSQQAINGANASPLFGFGAPQPVVNQSGLVAGSPAIGTQGQLWTVLFSNGYPAAALFICFYLAVLWQTRRARGTPGLWLHAVPLVALAQIAVYGWLPVEQQVVMAVAALAYRSCWWPAADRESGGHGHGHVAGSGRPELSEAASQVPNLVTVP